MGKRGVALVLGLALVGIAPAVPGTVGLVEELLAPRLQHLPATWDHEEGRGTRVSIEARLDRAVDGEAHLDVRLDAPDHDVVLVSETLTFADGTSTAFIELEVADDDVAEEDETYEVIVEETDEIAVDGGSRSVALTIVDDDRPPAIVVLDQTHQHEGTSTTEGATAPWGTSIHLTKPADHTVEVDWTTVSGTGRGGARAGSDFVATSGTAVIAAGQQFPARVPGDTIPVFTDLWPEADETFRVVITDVRGAVLEDGSADYLLRNDDPPVVATNVPAWLTSGG